MCFSEEASFTAAAVLAAVGLGSLYKARLHPERYLVAAIPLFFAFQQASEGLQWRYFNGDGGSPQMMAASRDIFLFIALIFWPTWVPFSVLVAERSPSRKGWLYAFFLIGLMTSAYFSFKLLMGSPVSKVVENSVQYYVGVSEYAVWPYFAAVVFPWFTSSLKYTNLVGVAFSAAFIIAGWIYFATFASVWCFFCALISMLVYMVVSSAQTK